MSIFDNLIKSLKEEILFLIHKFTYRPAEVFSFVRYKNDENNTDEFEFYIEGHDFLGFPTTFIIDEDSMKKICWFLSKSFFKRIQNTKVWKRFK